MKIPRLRKIKDTDIEVKTKIEEMIEEALQTEHINSYPIEDFTLVFLDLLDEYAKENNVLIGLKAEHSNLHQGVLGSLIKRDIASEFLKYL